MRNNRAFTLVELLVVLTIISVLVAMLLPAVQGAKDAAQTVKCGNNVRSFMVGLFNFGVDNSELVPAKFADNICWDGNSFNALPGMVKNGYVQTTNLICPTTPPVYRYKYTGTTAPWNRNDTTFKPFYDQSAVYNVPFGTYTYVGGANDENASSVTQSYRLWDTQMDGISKYQMKASHINKPAEYSPMFDQDQRRNYGVPSGNVDAIPGSSHRYNPGRNFGFYDGHVRWYADKSPEVANCTQTNWMKGTEHITPFVSGWYVSYSASLSVHGTSSFMSSPPAVRPNKFTNFIMALPGG